MLQKGLQVWRGAASQFTVQEGREVCIHPFGGFLLTGKRKKAHLGLIRSLEKRVGPLGAASGRKGKVGRSGRFLRIGKSGKRPNNPLRKPCLFRQNPLLINLGQKRAAIQKGGGFQRLPSRVMRHLGA